MRDTELLADWINDINRGLLEEIKELSESQLRWQPDAEANNIGETVWHCARWLDVLNVQVLQNQPAESELWHTRGWRAKTGYDPRGIGRRGLGTLTGYSPQEVEALPKLSAAELTEYVEQVGSALREKVLGMSGAELERTAPGLQTKASAYAWLKDILQGCFGHIGEIQALKAMQQRRVNS